MIFDHLKINTRYGTLAAMTAFCYEVVLKCSVILFPTFFKNETVAGLTGVLSFSAGLVIIFFLIAFAEEKEIPSALRVMLYILALSLVLTSMARLPIVTAALDIRAVRIVQHVFSVAQTLLILFCIVEYRRRIPFLPKKFAYAVNIVMVLFTISFLLKCYSAAEYAQFLILGVENIPGPQFSVFIFVHFLLTHGALLLFLFRYLQVKKLR